VRLQFITNKSPEGFQFCKGFGGIGAFLRYKSGDSDALNQDYIEEKDEDFI
jgi:peptide chain release factor subunit 1